MLLMLLWKIFYGLDMYIYEMLGLLMLALEMGGPLWRVMVWSRTLAMWDMRGARMLQVSGLQIIYIHVSTRGMWEKNKCLTWAPPCPDKVGFTCDYKPYSLPYSDSLRQWVWLYSNGCGFPVEDSSIQDTIHMYLQQHVSLWWDQSRLSGDHLARKYTEKLETEALFWSVRVHSTHPGLIFSCHFLNDCPQSSLQVVTAHHLSKYFFLMLLYKLFIKICAAVNSNSLISLVYAWVHVFLGLGHISRCYVHVQCISSLPYVSYILQS